MGTDKKNYFSAKGGSAPGGKISLVFFLCLLARLIPFRMPNIEPILAATMPLSKIYGAFVGFSFAVLSILSYDVITHTLGMQTFFTILAYGLLGVWSAIYFSNHEPNSSNYVRFAIMGTLFYDALTGLTVGPIFFHQSFLNSLVGQIPFTAFHLLGNITFAIILSPAIYKFMIKKKKFMVSPPNPKESELIISNLSPKLI